MDKTRIQHALKQEFVKRCRSKPGYSIRAFARTLDVDQSLLTKILRGQRLASQKTWSKIALALKLSPGDDVGSDSLSAYHRIEESDFAGIAEWSHFAILELIQIRGRLWNAKHIAQALGLSLAETELALKRLLERSLVAKKSNASYRCLSPNNTWTNKTATHPARIKLHKELLLKSAEALSEVDFSQRENASLTVAIRSEKIARVKKMIQEFKNSLREFAETDRQYDSVYQLVVGFYPLTRDRLGRE